MELRELYKAILESLYYTIDDKNIVFLFGSQGEKIPQTIKACEDRVLVLPTDEVLRNPDWTKYVAFHPISENVVRKESAIFKFLMKSTLLTVNTEIGELMTELVDICSDQDKQKNLNSKQTKFLQYFPEADSKSLENWMKIEQHIGGDNWYAKMVTLRDRKLNGESFIRTTTVTFPIYQELEKLVNEKPKEYHLFGVKIRKKDAIGYKALLEFLLPEIGEPNTRYSYGTRSIVAPSFHALMTSFNKVMLELQRVSRLLKREMASLKWGESLESLEKYRSIVPPLEGNEGEVTEQERRQVANTVQPVIPPKVTTPMQNPTATVVPPKQQVSQPVVGNGKLSMSQLMQGQQQQYQQIPPGYQYNQYGQLVPVQPQQSPLPAPIPVSNNNTVPQPVYGQPVPTAGYPIQPQPVTQPVQVTQPPQQVQQYPQYQQPQQMGYGQPPQMQYGYQQQQPQMSYRDQLRQQDAYNARQQQMMQYQQQPPQMQYGYNGYNQVPTYASNWVQQPQYGQPVMNPGYQQYPLPNANGPVRMR